MKTYLEKAENLHKPVLLRECVEFLAPAKDEVFVDATLGLGGHTEALLQSAENVRVIGIDQDTEAIGFARKRLEKYGDKLKIVHSNFSNIKQVLKSVQVAETNGVIADLGVSSLQFDSGERGFSFRFDAPLDMRMDTDSDIETAAELLERLSEEEIADVIYNYGEERFSRRIARRIVERRKQGEPVQTTKELAELVERSVRRGRKDKIHPATKTFQALRIAVNGELEILEDFISDSVDVLKKNGRLVIITFHSLEDRIVKHAFRKLSGKCTCSPRLPKCVCGAEKKIEILTKKPVIPTDLEQSENPRSRSAKVRACRKL